MIRKRIINYLITASDSGMKISAYLKRKNYPETALTNLRKEDGLILFDGEPVHMNHILVSGEDEIHRLEVVIKEDESSDKIEPVDLSVDILYEDEDILVVNKPPFMPIHPSLNNYDNSLANALAFYYRTKNEPFIFRCMNRLDRDTSGITLLAKHYLSAGILAGAVKNRLVTRIYYAFSERDTGITGENIPEKGTIDRPIGRKDGSTIERIISEDGERAVTHYEIVDCFRLIRDGKAHEIKLFKCRLETGRTHQIRVHLKSAGYPLVGDFLYNPDNRLMNRQALHAGYLSFTHPITGEFMEFSADFPEDIRQCMSGERDGDE